MTLSLITDNPYRVFGVTSAASSEALQHAYQTMMTSALKGQEISLGQDMSAYLKEPLRTPYRLDACKNELNSRRRRLQHALFWFIDSNPIDHAALFYLVKGNSKRFLQILKSSPSFSSHLNLAIFALLEDRFDDAVQEYEACFQNKDYTEQFIAAVVQSATLPHIRGAEFLYKINEAISQARRCKEEEDASDVRALVGGGAGVSENAKQRQKLLEPLVDRVPSLSTSLGLRQQANKFDRHLCEALDALSQKLSDIDRHYAVTESLKRARVDIAICPAASLVLDELTHFFNVNGSLIASFKQHCEDAGVKTLYDEYVYDLTSLVHHVFHLYVNDFGRLYSQQLLLKMRSITLHLDRLAFRRKTQDIEFLLSSMKRLEDVVPYLSEVARSFEKHLGLSDDSQLVKHYFIFKAECDHICERFLNDYATARYTDCALHMQDMVVRSNIGYLTQLMDAATRRDFSQQGKQAESEELKAIEMQPLREDDDDVRVSKNEKKTYLSEETSPAKERAPVVKKLTKQDKIAARKYKHQQKKKKAILRKTIGPERKHLVETLSELEQYTLSHDTMELLKGAEHRMAKMPGAWSIQIVALSTVALGGLMALFFWA